jgi:hypothetical protein
VFDAMKGVVKGTVQMGKAAVESVLSSPSANKRKRQSNQQSDSLAGTTATSSTRHKKISAIDLCDSDSDTDGETMIPSQQKNRAESSSRIPEVVQGFRDCIKEIFQKTPNRNIPSKDDDGQVQEYLRPSYMEPLLQPKDDEAKDRTTSSSKHASLPFQPSNDAQHQTQPSNHTSRKETRITSPSNTKRPPSSWTHEEEEEEKAKVPTRSKDMGARRGDAFDQVLGGAETSRASKNATARSIQHQKSSEPTKSPCLGMQPLNVEKVNGRTSQDDIDEEKIKLSSPELIDMCSDSEEEGGKGSDHFVQVSEPCGAEVTMISYVLSIH